MRLLLLPLLLHLELLHPIGPRPIKAKCLAPLARDFLATPPVQRIRMEWSHKHTRIRMKVEARTAFMANQINN